MGRRAVGGLMFMMACATPYQSKGFSGGYSDSRIADDTYQVTFAGNGYTGLDDAQQYVMRRAGEICPRGFDVVAAGAVSENTGTMYQRNAFGGVNAYQLNKPQASATVRCRGSSATYAVDGSQASAPSAPPAPPEPWAQRRIFAAKMNAGLAMNRPTVDVTTERDADDVLVITTELCGDFLPGLLAKDGMEAGLVSRGFVRIECHGGREDEAVALAPGN
jgi:hypothetical protein